MFLVDVVDAFDPNYNFFQIFLMDFNYFKLTINIWATKMPVKVNVQEEIVNVV